VVDFPSKENFMSRIRVDYARKSLDRLNSVMSDMREAERDRRLTLQSSLFQRWCFNLSYGRLMSATKFPIQADANKLDVVRLKPVVCGLVFNVTSVEGGELHIVEAVDVKIFRLQAQPFTESPFESTANYSSCARLRATADVTTV